MDAVALLAQAGEGTSKIVEQIAPEQLGNDTPCSEWDVRGVLNHLVGENYMFATLLAGKALPDTSAGLPDFVGDDPAGAYAKSLTATLDAWRKPGAQEQTIALPMGPTPASFALGLHFMDTLVHGWDLARGTDQDAPLDTGLATACLEIVGAMLHHGRPPVFGPEVTAAADASAGDRLVALLGREPS
jgi:uncharacterized protein (TIGR03086 family)